jgi:serine/threonine protein kinase
MASSAAALPPPDSADAKAALDEVRAGARIAWGALTPDPTQAPLAGGMGVCLRAQWHPTRLSPPVLVAVKILKAGDMPRELAADLVGVLERESKMLAAASRSGLNPFVVQHYGMAAGEPTEGWRRALGKYAASVFAGDGGAGEELHGLVMRWEPGGTLASRLHGATVPWQLATVGRLQLLAQVCLGLAHLHGGDPSIRHGDIKSDNVLLSKDDEPRLSDFGLSTLKKAVTTSGGATTFAPSTRERGTWM